MENILPRGRNRRLLNGAVLALLTVATAIALVIRSAEGWWFILVFLLAWLSALMLLQARDRT